MKKRYNELKPMYHTDHKRPVTRRELVAQGFMHGAAFVGAPSLLGAFALRTPEAFAAAEECGAAADLGANGGMGYIEIQAAGGYKSMVKNWLGGGSSNIDTAGWSDRAWERNGLAPEQRYNADGQNVNMEFGIPLHANTPFTQALMAKTSPECRANVSGWICTNPTENDTQNNVYTANNLIGLVQRGQFVQSVGSRARFRHQIIPGGIDDIPVQCRDGQQAEAFLNTGRAGEIFGGAQAQALEAATAIARAQSGTLDLTEANRIVMRCAYDVSKDQALAFGDPSILNFENDQNIVGDNPIFSANELNQREFETTASIMKMVVNGYAGTGCIEVGGCDYHNQDLEDRQHERDRVLAGCLGAILEYAHRAQRPVMICMNSDGSVASNFNNVGNEGFAQFTGDNSATSGSAYMVYNPGGRANMNTQQIGGIGTDGNCIVNNAATGNPVGYGHHVLLNYLSANNRVGEFTQLVSNSPLGSNSAAFQQYIAINPLPGL